MPVPNDCARTPLPDRIQKDHPSSCKSGVLVAQEETGELTCLNFCSASLELKRSQQNKRAFC